jgi:AraC family transcriptional regulator, regulatory protein of adaptative response / DNA-3-methyladenine glycosylase II
MSAEAIAGVETMRLIVQPPYDWSAALEFLARRAIDGVERIDSAVYRRTIRADAQTGVLEITREAVGRLLVVTVRGFSKAAAKSAIGRVRRMFDVEADIGAIVAHLGRDPLMAPLVAARPALRVLRGWDGFEVAARTVIGQQVTVARARHLNGVLVDRCGASRSETGVSGLGRLFPTPGQVLAADLSSMGMPGARVDALRNVAAAALDDPQLFDASPTIDDTIARLRAIRGIGDWTAHYIAMRACGEPDAFPASDVGLLRAVADANGRRPSPAELVARAEAWRPWRAYAAHQLWAADAARSAGSQGNRRFKSKSRSARRLQERHSQ